MTVEQRRFDPERRIHELELTLPTVPPPTGRYTRSLLIGDALWVSGHLPDSGGEPIYLGKLGRDLTTEQGYEAARQAAICLLSTIRAAVGNLGNVDRVVKLLGMVNSTDDFIEQPQVIDGASDLLEAVFGDGGVHTRSAVGMAQLPRNNCVEIEALVTINQRMEGSP